MKYRNIIDVGPEYLEGEHYYALGNYTEALKHYKACIDHYDYADNEYMLSPDKPYSINNTKYPSPNECASKSADRINEIYKKGQF